MVNMRVCLRCWPKAAGALEGAQCLLMGKQGLVCSSLKSNLGDFFMLIIWFFSSIGALMVSS